LGTVPSHDPKTGLLSSYYYQRGRVVDPAVVFDNPLAWPPSEPMAAGSRVTFDSGNVNVTVIGDTHYATYYSGKAPDTAIMVSAHPAPSAKKAEE
jgi:hypothetical protein